MSWWNKSPSMAMEGALPMHDISRLHKALGAVSSTAGAFTRVVAYCRKIRETHQVHFIGNGGSAAIASHMAADWMKNGGFKARCYNDPAALTCLSNDLGYDAVFSMPIARFCRDGDVMFAVSSSGQSANILEAVREAQSQRAYVVTLSGFNPNNPLRFQGDVNFYVPAQTYGTVELSHLTILHMILDHLAEPDHAAA